MNHDLTLGSRTARLAPASARQSIWRRWLLGAFAPMTKGRLEIELPEGDKIIFGSQSSGDSENDSSLPLGIASTASMRIRRARFFRRCVLGGDIGFAEAFLDGDWETPNLTAVIAWFVHNIEHAPTMSGSRGPGRGLIFNSLRFAHRVGHWLRSNSVATARRNISEHYDLSNEFFALFLDENLMYSSARYSSANQTLEEAQWEKNEALCRALQLKPTDHVLEIGTGWGGWSLHAAREHGCRITTITLSAEQRTLALKRIAEAGLSKRIEVRLEDYRHVQGSYDKIVSIEMMEAIGHAYLPAFCQALHQRLKPEGIVAFQFIACPDARYDELRKGIDFIQKYIFPGSLLLSINRVNQLLAREGGFTLHSLSDLGHSYARTLREWRDRFQARLTEVRALGFDDRFIRKWEYYLCYCEAAFALRNITVVQASYSRPNNLALA